MEENINNITLSVAFSLLNFISSNDKVSERLKVMILKLIGKQQIDLIELGDIIEKT